MKSERQRQVQTVVRCTALAVCAPFLAACGSIPPPAIGATATQPAAELGQESYSAFAPQSYTLRPADKISIVVYREPDLSVAEVAIGLDGNVALPLVGSVPARGRTAGELGSDLERRLLAEGLRRPQVSVNLIAAASHRMTVEGGVMDPGVYEFQPGDRLSAALALANGPSRTANLKEVAIFRETDAGMTVAKFDYRAVSQGTQIDPVLEPGDRVVVGLSGLSQFWQDFLRALPAFGLFTNVGI